MTNEQINELRDYINTSSGKKLLELIAQHEIDLQMSSWALDTTTDKQIRNINKASGVYWVRTLISDLLNKK